MAAPDSLTDDQLAQLFYPGSDTRTSSRYQVPDWAAVHQELKRKGITKQLLWEEYTQQYPSYSYSQFCDRYLHCNKQQRRSMRQLHKAGGKSALSTTTARRLPLSAIAPVKSDMPRSSGASNYTYAEATGSLPLGYIDATVTDTSKIVISEIMYVFLRLKSKPPPPQE